MRSNGNPSGPYTSREHHPAPPLRRDSLTDCRYVERFIAGELTLCGDAPSCQKCTDNRLRKDQA